MKIGIIGAGAMGSLFAAHFYRAGLDTVILESDPPTVESMREGFTLRDGDQGLRIIVPVSTDPSVLASCSVIFLFVKAFSTEEAVKMAAAVNGSALIVSLQNGLGNREIIERFVPRERIVFGTASYGAYKTSPSEVHAGGRGQVVLGGADRRAAETVRGLLDTAGILSRVTEDPERAVWEKAVINAGINPIGAILSIPNGRILSDPHAALLQEYLVREAVLAAECAGIRLSFEDMLSAARQTCERTSSNLCSMLQDINSGKATEIDFITGRIVNIAKESGLQAPFNEAMLLLVKSLKTGTGSAACGTGPTSTRKNRP